MSDGWHEKYRAIQRVRVETPLLAVFIVAVGVLIIMAAAAIIHAVRMLIKATVGGLM